MRCPLLDQLVSKQLVVLNYLLIVVQDVLSCLHSLRELEKLVHDSHLASQMDQLFLKLNDSRMKDLVIDCFYRSARSLEFHLHHDVFVVFL